MTPEQAAWVAGLLEGEGSFTHLLRGKCLSVRLNCSMTDLDVLEKLQKTTGIGSITSRKLDRDTLSRKPSWDWHASKRSQVVPLLEAIKPYMGIRRREKIEQLLQMADQYPIRGRWPKGGD